MPAVLVDLLFHPVSDITQRAETEYNLLQLVSASFHLWCSQFGRVNISLPHNWLLLQAMK